MKLPWYINPKFEMRLVYKQEYLNYKNQHYFIIEMRVPSRIPFKKWTKWFIVENSEKYTSLDSALDSINHFKTYYLNKDSSKKIKNVKVKIEYERIVI